MKVDREATLKAARLARLKLTDAEVERLSADLGAIVGYVEQLGEVDTDGVEPLAHCLPLQNAFRDDAGAPSLPADAALGNAPKRAGDFYSVPPILEN
ncbi:MAG TPA: Asp-tRNA(Asn)/Glu-tRNA(Gln) amidotransferase subunit GatC [Planctomycetia bacterium]|jgi:aspartyl-tRNA(Asn)/glutamyl-tRNA(Gln) amidotransferase subunit C|nr:Asp-tRNA(Asn)/Glu-tRNA(Gln) amidotransferase subunit GatC [Planctomycetia bacterium]